MQQSLVHPSSATEATASATPACQPTNPAQAEICSRGTLDALRAEFQRHPPEVQDAALAATGLRLDDRATAADFGELLVAAQAQVQVQAATQDEAAASTARYAAVVTEVLLTMDADIALLLQQADALDLQAAQEVERADDYATDVCGDLWGCTGGGMAAASGRAEAADLRSDAATLRARAERLQSERDALNQAVFGPAHP